MESAAANPSWFPLFNRLIGFILVITGFSVLLGWIYQIEPLVTLFIFSLYMKANAALCFFLFGLVLIFYTIKSPSLILRSMIILFAGIILIINTATLIENIFGIDLGIDQWLAKDIYIDSGTIYPGRMAVITTINFLLSAIAFLYAQKDKFSGWILQFIGWLIFLMALTSLYNYINKADLHFIVTNATTMSMHATLLFLLISIGIFLLKPESGFMEFLIRKSVGGSVLRRMLPITLIVPIFLSYFTDIFEFSGDFDPNFSDTLNAVGTFSLISIAIALMANLIYKIENELRETRTHTREQIQSMTKHDILTSLLNRAALEEELDTFIAKAKPTFLGVLILDIDNFKLVNDALGHDYGDLFLKSAALKIKNQTTEINENLARLGADKFVIYCEKENAEDVFDYAKKIYSSFNEPLRIAHNEITLSLSIGIAIYPQDGQDSKTLITHADLALAHAKSLGKNKIEFFTKELTKIAADKLAMYSDLHKAILNNEFYMNYQPQVDLKTGKICGAEALVRWQHPVKGLISPSEFISYAEKAGLIVSVNEHMMRMVFQQLKSHPLGLPVAVNISTAQFKDNYHLVEYLESLVKEFDINPKWVELEITESVLLENIHHNIAILGALHNLGFQFSIDDFGTGFSSFSYLQRLPAHKIKIDKSFITGLPKNHSNAAIVRSMIAMFHALQKKVVAEGAETEGEIHFLKKEHCDMVQGYYYYKPMPPDEFIALLSV